MLDLEACLNQHGILCDDSAVVCSEDLKAIGIVGHEPRVDEWACVGLGLCAVHCAAEPTALQIRTRAG